MSQQDNLLDVIRILMQKRRTIFVITAICMLAMGVFAFLSPNYYQSTTVFYAASADLVKPEHLFGTASKDMDYYGDDHDNDRLFTIASSAELVDSMVHDFDLYRHYGIDSSSKLAAHRVKVQFMSLYKVIKTKYNALELTIEDVDPELAARMARGARERINSISQRLIKLSQASLMETYRASIADKEQMVSAMRDSLAMARKKYGIYSGGSQSEEMADLLANTEAELADQRARLQSLTENSLIRRDTVAMAAARVKGLEAKWHSLADPGSSSTFNITRLNAGKGLVDQLEADYVKEVNQLGYDKLRTKMLDVALGSKVSALHIVEEAEVPLIKSRPKRSIWILSAGLAGLLFSVLGVLIQQHYSNVDWSSLRRRNQA